MRNSSRPLRWIEQAEARQVLATAAFERTARPSAVRRCARQYARQLVARLRRWLIPGNSAWRPLLQAQPARAGGPSCRRNAADDGGYPHWW